MRYLLNLLTALMGINPYKKELKEKCSLLEKSAAHVDTLYNMYYKAVDDWDTARKEAASLQKLVENLRDRIKEKDAEMEAAGREFHDRMERMKADYQRRIGEYNEKIEELQKLIPQIP